jgi:hypothetical protein
MARFTLAVATAAALIALSAAAPLVVRQGNVTTTGPASTTPIVADAVVTTLPTSSGGGTVGAGGNAKASGEGGAVATGDPLPIQGLPDSAPAGFAPSKSDNEEPCLDGGSCKTGGLVCTETPWYGVGETRCLPAPPTCYKDGERNVGADGEIYVPYAPCCNGAESLAQPQKGYGRFCTVGGATGGNLGAVSSPDVGAVSSPDVGAVSSPDVGAVSSPDVGAVSSPDAVPEAAGVGGAGLIDVAAISSEPPV